VAPEVLAPVLVEFFADRIVTRPGM
jgi:hypothetical protein